MDNSAGFLIYAALYRLTVLAVGALSIWLGFRLFSTAGSKKAEGSASAEPVPEAEEDFRAALRATKKNLLLMDQFVYGNKHLQ